MGTTIISNICDFLIRLDPFDKLPENLVEFLSNTVKVSYLTKGEEIEFSVSCEQRYLYIIRTGAVEQRTPKGELRARLGDEDQFGFTFLAPLMNLEDGYRVVAIDDTLLYLIPHQELHSVCEDHPEFANYFAAQAQVRLKSAVDYVCKKEEKGLFFQTVGEVASENIAIVQLTDSIKHAAHIMCYEQRSSCAVVMDHHVIVGIVTDRDMTKGVSNEISSESSIRHVMTPSPILIQSDSKVIQAISLMLEYNIRCLPVVRKNRVVGLLTTTHLVHGHKTQSLFLIEKIKYACSVHSLVNLCCERKTIFQTLVESGVSAEIQGRVMSMIMDAFTRRIIQLTEDELGTVPCEYSWVVAGSHARNEVHMLSDQDNALILSDNATSGDRHYFTYFAMRVCNSLAACGYPLCNGKYMAASPKWCQPISRWKGYYQKWVASPEYNRLLSISVFLEVRSVYGNSEFVDQIQQHLHDCIQASSNFLPALVKDAISTQPPLGIFNKLVLEKGGDNSHTLNIKKYALNLIIDLARIFCLSAGGMHTGTEERFRYAAEHGMMSQDSCENIIGAYQFITQVRFRHQLEAIRHGKTPNNHIVPDRFSSFERKHLKDAFKIISELQEVAKLRFVKRN